MEPAEPFQLWIKNRICEMQKMRQNASASLETNQCRAFIANAVNIKTAPSEDEEGGLRSLIQQLGKLIAQVIGVIEFLKVALQIARLHLFFRSVFLFDVLITNRDQAMKFFIL